MKLSARILGLVVVASAACGPHVPPVRIREPNLGGPAPATRAVVAPLVADGRAWGNYLKAIVAAGRGDLETAKTQMRAVVALDPQSATPRIRLAEILLAQGRSDEAGHVLAELKADPGALPPGMLELYLMYAGGKSGAAAARAAIRAAVENGQLNPALLLQWVSEQERQTTPAELLEFTESLRKVDPQLAVLTCIDGHLRVRLGQYAAAITPLTHCLKAYPDWVPGMLERGLVAELMGEPDAARLWYQRVLAAQPGQALATWRLRALADPQTDAAAARDQLEHLLDEVRFETTLQLAADALRDNDVLRSEAILHGLDDAQRSRPRLRLLLGLIAEQRDDLREAARNYDLAATDADSDVRRIAYLQWVRVRKREAPKDWEKSVRKRYVADPSAELALALALGLAEDDPQRAIALLEEARAVFPGDTELRYRLGVLYEQAGRRAEALQQMEDVVAANPRHAEALNFLGYTLAEENRDLERAERLLRAAIELKPNAGHIMDSVGWVLFRRGKIDEAIPWLERALETEGDDWVVLEHLADAYAAANRPEYAREVLRRALEATDDPEAIQRIQDKILKLGE